jgi:nucleolar protein 14
LESLHEMIAKFATTGKDASTIIQRIHRAHSVRLDRRNGEKMQNFYDVILRRFLAVGDAIFASGDGGEELGRYEQLTCLIKVMYTMAQDSPDRAGAVWSRRIGIFQNAHAKRLRDSDFLQEEEEELITAWPSTGTFLLFRALGHVFPVTDKRHFVVTPAILLLGQMVAQTPVNSSYDVALGVLCSGLLLEYTKDAQRVVPEALGFLSGVIRLFSPNPGHFALPSLEAAYNLPVIKLLRERVSEAKMYDGGLPALELESDFLMDDSPDLSVAILSASLDLIERYTQALQGSFSLSAETELLSEVSDSILSLRTKGFPEALKKKVAATASVIAEACPSSRTPVRRRAGASTVQAAIKSLAPRMEDPERYSMSKDKGKKSVQTAIDRTRREYKREHKAIASELRKDGAFIENERRTEQTKKDEKERAKRQKNFIWLEGEQASMNQQVRLGGGLLKGGGMAAAKAKVASAKLGIKKGGKF